jgi:hypothetical protein
MPKTFFKNRTTGGVTVMVDAIDHARKNLQRAEKRYGRNGSETLGVCLTLAAMYCVAEDHEKAEPLLKECIASAKNNLPQNATVFFWASGLLAEAYFAMHRIAEAMMVSSQMKPLSRAVNPSAPDPVFESLWHLALSFETERKLESRQQGLVVALMALCWFVSRGLDRRRADAPAQEDLRLHFSSYGIVLDEWNWLIKHAHLTKYDFVGLLSIVLGTADTSPVSAESWMKREPRVHVIR